MDISSIDFMRVCPMYSTRRSYCSTLRSEADSRAERISARPARAAPAGGRARSAFGPACLKPPGLPGLLVTMVIALLLPTAWPGCSPRGEGFDAAGRLKFVKVLPTRQPYNGGMTYQVASQTPPAVASTAPAQDFSPAGDGPQLSIVIPVFNEEDNVDRLYARLLDTLPALGRSFEILFIDDGSSDGSYARLAGIAAADRRVKVVRFVRNFGQTAALVAGIDHAAGQVIVPMDADLQNDPGDIGLLLAKLDEGYDV